MDSFLGVNSWERHPSISQSADASPGVRFLSYARDHGSSAHGQREHCFRRPRTCHRLLYRAWPGNGGQDDGRGALGGPHPRAGGRPIRHRHDADPGRPQPARADEVSEAEGGRRRTEERTGQHAGHTSHHVRRRRHRRRRRAAAQARRRALRRGGAVREHVPPLLPARPGGHHHRAGRADRLIDDANGRRRHAPLDNHGAGHIPNVRCVAVLAVITAAACSSPPAARPPDGGAVCSTGATAGDGTLASVASIVVRRCAKAGCHDPIQHEHGMDLSTADLIYQNWVDKKGLDHCSNMAQTRVVPGDPDGSFVMMKIRAQGVLCSLGTRMPPPPDAMLPACEIDTISAWIAAGAPGPGGETDGGGMDSAADVGGDAAEDAGDDADPDALDPGVCTATRPCDPASETCVEVMPAAAGDCYTRWECYAHAPDDDTVAHACPPEVATFCGCDGMMFEASYACPNRPYDHIGVCGDGYSCDAYRVRCADPRPSCPDGQVPPVIGGCWGPCVPIAMCRCDQHWRCPQGYLCSLLPEFRCGLPTDGGVNFDAPVDGG